jgi:hypothetical protein
MASKMKSAKSRLKPLAESVGFTLIAVLALVHNGTASAANGPAQGSAKTACGDGALANNTTGRAGSAFGDGALLNNNTGDFNTAIGSAALVSNTSGTDNTASGPSVLNGNTKGSENTADGFDSLATNTGSLNTAVGAEALRRNTDGGSNTASGGFALSDNVTGRENTASDALGGNSVGTDNTADGFAALASATGHDNIAVGGQGGQQYHGGQQQHRDRVARHRAGDSGTIRIGTNGTQKSTLIAGISAAKLTGRTVEVNRKGQPGIAPSAARYKRDIRDMGQRAPA